MAKPSIAVVGNDVKHLMKDVAEIKHRLEVGYVSKEEFEPIRKIVYGMVTLTLIAVIGAVIRLVVIQ